MPLSRSILFVPGKDGHPSLSSGSWSVLVGAASFMLMAAWMYPAEHWALVATVGATALFLFCGVLCFGFVRVWLDAGVAAHIRKVHGWERVPCFLTDQQGQIQWRNSEAEVQYRFENSDTLSTLLQEMIADPAKLLADLRIRANVFGHALEMRAVGDKVMHLSVFCATRNELLWRIEETETPRSEAPNRGRCR